MSDQRVCLVPRLSGVGGMVSFQGRLAAGLARRGVEVCFELRDRPYQAVLVIGGARHLAGLWQARRRGVRIVQRLNGMNWIHRHRRTGLRHFLRAEYGNWLLSFIRRRLADHIVYQSQFSRSWWESVYGPTRISNEVIYNGVDLSVFSPAGNMDIISDRFCILIVEGNLGGGYEGGLETALQMAARVEHEHHLPVEVRVAGRVAPALQADWQKRAPVPLIFAGVVPHDQIPALDRSAHVLYAADIHAACPNSVIEALACGLPVVAYDTGAMKELVQEQAGLVVPYGSDPWMLEPPDLPILAQAAAQVLQEQPVYRTGARRRAEALFSVETMVDRYCAALLPGQA